MGIQRERAEQLKEKRPGYAAVLDFYVKVREAQDASRASLQVVPMKVKKQWKELLAEEGFSLIEKGDFPVDVEAAVRLFHEICRIGKTANPHMDAQIEKINQALNNNKMDLKKLLIGGGKEQTIGQVAVDLGIDKHVLSFLVKSSTNPSIEAGMKQLSSELDLESWRKVHCPVCGSLPGLSLLKGEGGMRYSLCSYCGCQWRIDRLSCSVCGSKEQGSLQYFCAEGEEAMRIDLCDKCHHYIKTIDYRSLEGSDPYLEDLATLHLDVVAVQKGYTRAVPNFWIT